jgi:hypothetical protein
VQESTLPPAFILSVNTSAGDIVGLEAAAKQLPNLLCVVELQTLLHIVELGRYDAVPYLPTCQQYLQAVLHIAVLGDELGNVVQLTLRDSDIFSAQGTM